jgi:hypothetical protein
MAVGSGSQLALAFVNTSRVPRVSGLSLRVPRCSRLICPLPRKAYRVEDVPAVRLVRFLRVTGFGNFCPCVRSRVCTLRFPQLPTCRPQKERCR